MFEIEALSPPWPYQFPGRVRNGQAIFNAKISTSVDDRYISGKRQKAGPSLVAVAEWSVLIEFLGIARLGQWPMATDQWLLGWIRRLSLEVGSRIRGSVTAMVLGCANWSSKSAAVEGHFLKQPLRLFG